MAIYPWDTRRDITSRELVDELRMPRIYGETWGDPLGMVDPAALTALSQGGGYDIQARRNAIAKRLLENQLAQQAAQAAPTADAALPGEGVDQYRFSGTEPDYGIGAGDAASAGTMSAGQGSQSFGDMIGGRANDFMSGAPPGSSMFGTGDRATFDPGGTMVSAPASMVADPNSTAWDTVNTDRAALPAGAPPGWGFAGAPGDPDAPGAFTGRGGPGREGRGEVDVDAIAANAPATPAGYAPDFGRATPNADIAITATGRNTPTGPVDVFSSGGRTFGAPPTGNLFEGQAFNPMAGAMPAAPAAPTGWSFDMGKVIDAFGNVVDTGKTMVGRGWDVVTAPVMTPGVPVDRAPVATNTPQPTGRAPIAFAQPAPGEAISGPGASPGGFGGFSESSPGGYTSGPGMTTGFGAGYSGSSDFGNTQGGQGFTAGAPGGGFSPGAASFDPGSGGDVGPGGGGGGSGAGQGSGDTSGSSGGGAGDTAGGAAGSGVG